MEKSQIFNLLSPKRENLDKIDLEPGEYSFPFDVILTKDAPPSFKCSSHTIEYHLEVTADGSNIRVANIYLNL